MNSTLNSVHPPGLEQPPPGQVLLGGELHYVRADGARIPAQLVKASDKLEDDAVRRGVAGALAMSAAMAAFKSGEFETFDTLRQILAGEYNAPKGGVKGNVTFQTIDGLFKVTVAVADRIVFGPELQVAKSIVDQLLTEWGEGSPVELQAVVQDAFRVDNEKQVNRGALLGLMRLEIKDERWRQAMQAITDSMRVEGSKRYIRFHKRADAAVRRG